jgi:hypothetical protein
MSTEVPTKPRLFDLALKEMAANWVKGPESFKAYKERAAVPGDYKTQKTLSVQSHLDVRPELREKKTMIFRLGAHSGPTTSFALARADKWPDDYFILNSIFDKPRTFLSRAPVRELYTFKLIKLVERTLVNLALISGVLAVALDLDDHEYSSPGATGQSRYDFTFRPHSADDTELEHLAGQVDIDLLFVAQRKNEDIAFVVEAKYDDPTKPPKPSIAKHKLLFPVLAIRENVPEGMKIVPVYLNATPGEEVIDFQIAECEHYLGGDLETQCVDKLTVKRTDSLRLPVYFPLPSKKKATHHLKPTGHPQGTSLPAQA